METVIPQLIVVCLVGSLLVVGVGIALAATAGSHERRRRVGWWIVIVAMLFVLGFGITGLLGLLFG